MEEIIKNYNTVLEQIRISADEADRNMEEIKLIIVTKKFDGFDPNPMQVSANDLKDAWDEIDNNLKRSLVVAHERIQKFHEKEIPQSFTIKGEHGDTVQRRWRPVKNAGIYIPGGRAAYPSTVLMNAIPARVAGVKEIIMVSPGNKEGEINKTVLAAAHLSGIKKVFRIGGAQAICSKKCADSLNQKNGSIFQLEYPLYFLKIYSNHLL